MKEPIEIRITWDEENGLDVWKGDTHTGSLCFGEMLEQVAGLLAGIPQSGRTYHMATDDGWEEMSRKRQKAFTAIDSAPQEGPR